MIRPNELIFIFQNTFCLFQKVSDLMDRTVTSFPSMDSNALAKFNKELKLHEQQGTKEEMSTTVEKSEKSKNEMVKEEPTESGKRMGYLIFNFFKYKISAFSAPELSNKRKRKSKPQQQTNVMECDKAEMDKNVADQTPKSRKIVIYKFYLIVVF